MPCSNPDRGQVNIGQQVTLISPYQPVGLDLTQPAIPQREVGFAYILCNFSLSRHGFHGFDVFSLIFHADWTELEV